MILIQEDTSDKMPGGNSLFISFNYKKDIVDIIKSCGEASYLKNTNEWEVPISKLSYLLDSLTPIDDIDLRIQKVEEKKNDTIFNIGPFKTNPYQYQQEGIQYALNHDKFLLLDAPGLGKTLQAIYAAEELHKREGLEHCLIICGINTLKRNWKKEIDHHSVLSSRILGTRYKGKKGSRKEYIGSVKDRIQDLSEPIDDFFVITNVETIRDPEIVKLINKGPNKFDMIVCDECHKMKSPTSQQGKNFLKLTNAKHKMAMTGTMLLNSPLDSYVPLKWIGVENSTFTNFKFHYCTFTGPYNNILIGYKNMDALKDMISEHSLRRTKELLDLPEKTVIDEYVDMEDAQEKFYTNIINGVKEQVDKVDLKPASVLGMAIRFRQATACPTALTTENIPCAKIDRAVELANQITENGEKVVIFSAFKETVSQLAEQLKDLNPLVCTGDIDDSIISSNIDLFQEDDEHKVILATVQKMGTGITLTRASYAIFVDCSWTAAENEQCEDRIYRIGSKKPVFIYYLWTNDTFDAHVKEVVDSKEAISDFIIDNKVSSKSVDILRKYILEEIDNV